MKPAVPRMGKSQRFVHACRLLALPLHSDERMLSREFPTRVVTLSSTFYIDVLSQPQFVFEASQLQIPRAACPRGSVSDRRARDDVGYARDDGGRARDDS